MKHELLTKYPYFTFSSYSYMGEMKLMFATITIITMGQPFGG